jgi:predicted aconitase with swiveling domain
MGSGPMPDKAESINEKVRGTVLRLSEPLCFLVVDAANGLIMETEHPQYGRSIKDRILVLPGVRGGAATPSQLCDALRQGNGPLAIVLKTPDAALAAGAWVAKELYDVHLPVIYLNRDEYDALNDGEPVELSV